MQKILSLISLVITLSCVHTPLSATELHDAAKQGDIAKITALLNRGANIDARTDTGWTALHAAAVNGHSEAIITLLDRGADIEATSKDGFTALHAAAVNGHSEAIITLLDRGANAKARDDDGKRPIDYANDENIPKDSAYWQLYDAGF